MTDGNAGGNGSHPGLRAMRMRLHAQHQCIAIMHVDCHVCHSEGLSSRSQVLVVAGDREVQALLYQTDGELFGRDLVVLSEAAWDALEAMNRLAGVPLVERVTGGRNGGGTLLTEQAVTDNLVPGEGESLVGISLTPAQMPSEPLYGGDVVRIVTTPGDQGEVTDKEPVTIEATVVGVSRVEETGETVVDVSVPEADAADLAARAATGRVALVLDARER